MNETLAPERSTTVTRVPVIDLGPCLAGDPGAFEPTARALGQASESLGFYYVRNHGIPQALIDRAFAEAKRFHDLPLERKLAVQAVNVTIGYLPLGGQTQRTSIYGRSVHRDRSTSFYIRHEMPPGHPDRIAKRPWVYDNKWPQDLPGFRETVLEYQDAARQLGYRMLPLQAQALGLPRDYFTSHKAFDPAFPTLRLLHYPPRDPSLEGQWGIGPHTDYGYLTILAQAKVAGLEILTPEGDWVLAPALEGHLLLNNGDMCRRWTNDRFRSAPHRVINASGTDRYSIPVFFGVHPDVKLECLPTCQDPGNPPRYAPASYGDHMKEIQRINYDLPRDGERDGERDRSGPG